MTCFKAATNCSVLLNSADSCTSGLVHIRLPPGPGTAQCTVQQQCRVPTWRGDPHIASCKLLAASLAGQPKGLDKEHTRKSKLPPQHAECILHRVWQSKPKLRDLVMFSTVFPDGQMP